MNREPANQPAGRQRAGGRRGGILLEILMAVALFAGAAAFALGCVKSVFTALERTRREQEAVDLARSKMAELEAGLINLADLRAQTVDGVGSMSDRQPFDAQDWNTPRWLVDVKTSRSEFAGLSLVELTVREVSSRGEISEVDAMSYTLRQLMPLRRANIEQEYQDDELIGGLPEPGESTQGPER